ncbi:MAG: hypothetical protein U0793_24475 [Gemmataceae bacterium]
MSRLFSLALSGLALVVLSAGQLPAGDKSDKNIHTGTLVSVKGNTFVMESKGKEHSHTLATTAVVHDADGKDCKLADLIKGTTIRVTTKEGDPSVAMRVEATKRK